MKNSQKTTQNSLLYHLALWLPVSFATPLIVFIQNPDDFTGSIFVQILLLIALLGALTFASWLIVKILPSFLKKTTISLLLAIATALVVQGYIVHGLIEFGQLDGSIINWKELGPIYRTEYKAILLALIILTPLYFKLFKILKSLSAILIFFSLAQVLLVLPSYFQRETPSVVADKFNDSVYEFSSTKNIIHILADGFQADIVKQVFKENPDLAKEFTGFDFFDNHLGKFQGTAPTIPSILTGKFFDLNKGYEAKLLRADVKNNSYTNILFKDGYRLDFAPISDIYCHEKANSCVNRSFNDLKSRGFNSKGSMIGSLMLLVDISLFRHTPLYLKKRIHNNGAWLLSARLPKNWSQFPDPIIREWAENMVVASDQPMYKWYHFLGTHIPAQWDENCQYIGRQLQKRQFYKAQTHCVLSGMTKLFKKLKQQDIYDNSIIVISGDHGCNIPAADLTGLTKNRSTYPDSLLGVARPLFMIKKPDSNQPLFYNESPTTLEDIAPTILALAKLPIDGFKGISAFEKNNDGISKRSFHRYVTNTFWKGGPIAFNEYSVSGNIKDRENWKLVALRNREKAPTFYPRISYPTTYNFSKGFGLSIPKSDSQSFANVNGSEFHVLLSDLENKAKKVSVEMLIPPYSSNQSISLFINDKQVANSIKLDDVVNQWITQDIVIPENTLLSENNLFRFEFSKAGFGKSKKPVSAKIKSIYLRH